MDHRLLAMENDQALDFTSTPKRSISRDQSSLESSPVLDLSCKKHQSSAPSCTLSPLSIEAISNPPSIENPHGEQNGIGHEDDHDSSDHQSQHEVQHRRHDSRYVLDSDESKSPFEARNFMVTPPSEIDSPRKPKYETIYDRMSAGVASVVSSNDEKTLTSGYAMLPSGIALPSCPAAILSSIVMPQNGVEATSALQFPVSTTTTSSNSIAANLVHEISANGQHEVNSKKAPRPFKAYPKDPLSMSIGSAELVYDQTSTEAYSEFRKRMLESVRRTNEGTNIKMRRVTKSPGLPTSTMMDEKDAAYWERRRKNNEAAKRSRDARRAKEDEIAIRAAFLEQENMKLKYELVALRNETAKLRCMIYTN